MKIALVLCLGWFVSTAGCGGNEAEMGSMGTYGGPCHADGTCDEGLKCVYHVCKEE